MNQQNKTLQPLILVVEDEPSISSVIKYNLEKIGYRVHILEDGNKVLKYTIENYPALILLDWVLPSITGIEVCNLLRYNDVTANIPIIMISGRNEEYNKIEGLNKGADDYIVKPISPVELIARIKAVLRRIRPAFSDKILTFADIQLDLLNHTVTRDGGEVSLSPIEFQLLQIMIEQPNATQSREALTEKIWGENAKIKKRTIDVHITRLRHALLRKSTTGEDVIKSVRNTGYILRTVRQRKPV